MRAPVLADKRSRNGTKSLRGMWATFGSAERPVKGTMYGQAADTHLALESLAGSNLKIPQVVASSHQMQTEHYWNGYCMIQRTLT